MKTIIPSDISAVQLQQVMQTAIAPRPIALASTINAKGEVNLSPFSFFNMFSTVPPIVIISPSRRVRDNTTKHTLENLKEVPELVIGNVNFEMVQQVSLASTEYEDGINEFIKSGLTMKPADIVKPPISGDATNVPAIVGAPPVINLFSTVTISSLSAVPPKPLGKRLTASAANKVPFIASNFLIFSNRIGMHFPTAVMVGCEHVLPIIKPMIL